MNHPIALLFIIAAIVLIGVVLIWNLYPPARAAMKGYSTIAEGVIGVGLGIFGQFAGALQDAQAAGYIPPNLVAYLPYVLILWFIVKRFMTSTPAGVRESPS